MYWTELTIGQVSTMLLSEPTYREYWDMLKTSLRTANGTGTQTKLYPMYPITYALTYVAVWHALSVETDPNTIDLNYLENQYHLKDLLWDSSRPNGQFAFAQYLNRASGKQPEDALEYIKRDDELRLLNAETTLKELLDQIGQQREQNLRFIEILESLLEDWVDNIPEEDLPPRTSPPSTPEKEHENPSCDPSATEKGRSDLKSELDQTFARDVCDLIENGGLKQFLFTGAPGTGKTYAAKLLARYLGDLQEPPIWPLDASSSPRSYALVQFHPSYDYTDFVEGLRPNGQGFVKLDGSFKAFCRRVVQENQKKPGGKYFFIIDEINRAELSKVFGELMYCLDADKRGKEHRVQTQYQNLKTYDLNLGRELEPDEDVFADGFYLPENVYIIGTMNDIDRSVESMDFALRRRFSLLEAVVDKNMLLSAFSSMGFHGNEEKLTARVSSLNQTIASDGAAYGLNRQYFISHGQFANLPNTVSKTGPVTDILDHVWTYRLKNLLREYLRGMDESRIDTFVRNGKKAFFTEGSDT